MLEKVLFAAFLPFYVLSFSCEPHTWTTVKGWFGERVGRSPFKWMILYIVVCREPGLFKRSLTWRKVEQCALS